MILGRLNNWLQADYCEVSCQVKGYWAIGLRAVMVTKCILSPVRDTVDFWYFGLGTKFVLFNNADIEKVPHKEKSLFPQTLPKRTAHD